MGEGVVETFDPGLKRAFDVADNEIPKELRDPKKVQFQKDMLKVSGDDIFYTLQGEGPTMGFPAIFLRLKICNLACVWCDAFYTWNPKSKEFWTEGEDVSIEEIAKRLGELWGAPEGIQKRVVITGGEPLLQKDKIDLLINELDDDWLIEIETNGTIMPTEDMLDLAELPEDFLRFNCSPKLKNSGNIVAARKKPEVIRKLAKANTTFKFVVMTNEDLDEIEQEWIKEMSIPIDKVILMPQGVTAEEVRKNGQRVADYAKEKGYRLLGRLQCELWGARRRV